MQDIHAREYILRLREVLKSAKGKLVRSSIPPEGCFESLSYEAPKLSYDDIGISKTIVNVFELISSILLDVDSSTVCDTLVMLFEYYFLVASVMFKNEGPRFVNDIDFMKHYMKYIKSLPIFTSETKALKKLENLTISLDLYNPIKDIDYLL